MPEWEGDKGELLMVAGADTMLDILADGRQEVDLEVDLKNFPGATELDLRNKGGSEGGGYYFVSKHDGKELNLEMWLCDVTQFVFGHIPPKIYFQVRQGSAKK